MKSVVFKIRGMDCAQEVAVLQRELGPLVDSEAHLASDIVNGTMSCSCRGGAGVEDTIRQAVARTGMEAIPRQEYSALHDEKENILAPP